MKSPNHYWIADLRRDLAKLGRLNALDEIVRAEQVFVAAREEYRETVQRVFQENLFEIKPLLQPCHLKRIENLDVRLWH